MATAESVFPKVGGDPHYVSEIIPIFNGSNVSGTSISYYGTGTISGINAQINAKGVFSGTISTLFAENIHPGLGSTRTVGTTAEGVFPKVDGDIHYASEVNRFSPKLIGYNEIHTLTNVSGAAGVYTTLSSITYPGTIGSMTISQFMVAEVNLSRVYVATGNLISRLRISGTAGLNMVTSAKSNSLQGAIIHNFKHIYTSGTMTASGGNIGSDYVISIEANNNVDSTSTITDDFIVYGY